MGGLNKRGHLIKTGQELIWAKGYDLCSVKDITTAAGLPKGSFYHYFESKEKFALEAMNDFIETYPEQLPEADLTLESFDRVVSNRIKAIVKIQFSRECYMSVMCHAYGEQEDDFRERVLQAIEISNKAMRSLLARLQANRLIRDDLQLDELEESA